jgi:DNA-binding MarR family transcriptional regulator
MLETPESAAHHVLDVVPGVTRAIRLEFRKQRSADLSVPQFRVLAYTNSNSGTSLSALADHIGLTLPSMSKLVDGLVERGLMQREDHAEDRRRICLKLTPQGVQRLEQANIHTQTYLSDKLAGLDESDLATISQAMQILGAVFITDRPRMPEGQSGR